MNDESQSLPRELTATIGELQTGQIDLGSAPGAMAGITPRTQVADALRAAQAELQLVADSMAVAVTRCSRDLKYRWVNRHCADWLGQPPEEIIGRPIVEILGQEAFEELRHYFDQVLSGQKVSYEQQVNLRGLGSRWIHAEYSPTFDPSGQPDGWVAVIADITAHKQAEQALQESEERYRSLMEAIASVVWTTDADGRFVAPQPEWAEYTGQTWEQLREFGWVDALHPDDRAHVLELWQAARTARSVYMSDGRVWHAVSGGYRYFEARGVPIFHADGTVREWVGTCIDVEDRKRAEQALRASEERFSRFMQHLPGLAWIKDVEGRYVYANDAAEKAFQTSRETLYGQTDEEVFPPDVAAQFRENDRRALTERKGVQVIETLQHEDGVLHHSLVSKFPIPAAGGGATLVGGMAIDITERKQMEEALRESEARFRAMTDAAPMLVWMSGTDARCTYFNERWLRFTGRTLKQELGDGWSEGVHPDDVKRCLQTYAAAFDRREPFEMEFRLRRHDGEYRWILDRGDPRFAPDGTFLGYIGSSFDIDDRKRAEKQLQALNEQLEQRVAERTAELRLAHAAVQTTPAAVVIAEWDGTIVNWNRGAERLFGYSSTEARGRNIAMLIPADRTSEFDAARARLKRREFVREFETVRLHRDGSRIDVAVTVSSVEGETGEHICKIVRDLRERKRLEQQLAELADAERQHLGRELHDTLGQQITAMEMLASVLHDQIPTEGAAARIAGKLRDAALQAKQHVRRLMQGLVPVEIDAYGLRAALETLARATRETHGVDCLLDCPRPMLVENNFEATQLYWVAKEAVHNAVKHAKPKRLTIRLRDRQGLKLSVRDDGCGLPAAAKRPGGNGLHIMRHRCNLIGGVFRIEPCEGGGTEVTCSISSPE